MQRVSALWQASPNKIVGALVALALASMLAVASGASFTSTSANTGNIVTAGILSHDNSKDGAAILTVAKMVPDETKTGTVTLENDGDVDGVFTLSESNVDDSDATNPMSAKLDLTVTDITDPANPVGVYTGKLGAMTEQDLGTWGADEQHTYEFSVHFPDGGTPAGPNAGDNRYKGDSVEVDFNWESVSE